MSKICKLVITKEHRIGRQRLSLIKGVLGVKLDDDEDCATERKLRREERSEFESTCGAAEIRHSAKGLYRNLASCRF